MTAHTDNRNSGNEDRDPSEKETAPRTKTHPEATDSPKADPQQTASKAGGTEKKPHYGDTPEEQDPEPDPDGNP